MGEQLAYDPLTLTLHQVYNSSGFPHGSVAPDPTRSACHRPELPVAGGE
ncbi:hypothetical protein SBD_5031 [Streptomyces bottropensis ATCC 25435]|uniref:Uncharacterized protein n=1 Tax=Streptomyces bottropensis ATCC 25435 TaxID=1054862 RepID=M3DAX1_9ACTN|nr:hypothetical protein SBD_5031 [Streptomyces bottropensis ATCC 25435]